MTAVTFADTVSPMTSDENFLINHRLGRQKRHCITMADLYPDNPRTPWFVHAAHMLEQITLWSINESHSSDATSGFVSRSYCLRSINAFRNILKIERALRTESLRDLPTPVKRLKITAEIAALSSALTMFAPVDSSEDAIEALRERQRFDRARASVAKTDRLLAA